MNITIQWRRQCSNLGNLYVAKKDFDSAIELYQKALKIEPKNNLLYYNLAIAYSQKNEFEKAAKFYTRAIEIEPKMPDAYNNLAFVYYKLKQYPSALKDLQQAEKMGC